MLLPRNATWVPAALCKRLRFCCTDQYLVQQPCSLRATQGTHEGELGDVQPSHGGRHWVHHAQEKEAADHAQTLPPHLAVVVVLYLVAGSSEASVRLSLLSLPRAVTVHQQQGLHAAMPFLLLFLLLLAHGTTSQNTAVQVGSPAPPPPPSFLPSFHLLP